MSVIEQTINRETDSDVSPVRSEEGGVMAPPPHAHHWLIAEAKGLMSPGLCTCCGVWKQFKNWDSGHDFVLTVEARYAC